MVWYAPTTWFDCTTRVIRALEKAGYPIQRYNSHDDDCRDSYIVYLESRTYPIADIFRMQDGSAKYLCKPGPFGNDDVVVAKRCGAQIGNVAANK
ncbi:MAG: hypothetical protein HZB67_01010 [Candidatus Aenigmarchaeota archaeon]|nr:hypothetical protein [Candidatus Aenigmarchaeota archaeon]